VPMLASGRASAAVGEVFALDDAAEALDHVRTAGKSGKVLLEMPAT